MSSLQVDYTERHSGSLVALQLAQAVVQSSNSIICHGGSADSLSNIGPKNTEDLNILKIILFRGQTKFLKKVLFLNLQKQAINF